MGNSPSGRDGDLAVKTWYLQDGRHTEVMLQHGRVSGKRIITVDGKEYVGGRAEPWRGVLTKTRKPGEERTAEASSEAMRIMLRLVASLLMRSSWVAQRRVYCCLVASLLVGRSATSIIAASSLRSSLNHNSTVRQVI